MNKMISSRSCLLSAKREHKRVTMCPRGTCLKKESCVCLKVPIGNY